MVQYGRCHGSRRGPDERSNTVTLVESGPMLCMAKTSPLSFLELLPVLLCAETISQIASEFFKFLFSIKFILLSYIHLRHKSISPLKIFWRRRQEPFCADRKTYTTFVKYVIKYACTTNLVTNFKFVEEYAMNNKQIK
jgi:hypothetical protein